MKIVCVRTALDHTDWQYWIESLRLVGSVEDLVLSTGRRPWWQFWRLRSQKTHLPIADFYLMDPRVDLEQLVLPEKSLRPRSRVLGWWNFSAVNPERVLDDAERVRRFEIERDFVKAHCDHLVFFHEEIKNQVRHRLHFGKSCYVIPGFEARSEMVNSAVKVGYWGDLDQNSVLKNLLTSDHPQIEFVSLKGDDFQNVSIALFPGQGFLWRKSLVLKAYACGVIPVVHEKNVDREFVSDGRDGFVLHFNDPAMISKVVRMITREDDVRIRLQTAGREKYEGLLDPKKSGERLLRLIQFIP